MRLGILNDFEPSPCMLRLAASIIPQVLRYVSIFHVSQIRPGQLPLGFDQSFLLNPAIFFPRNERLQDDWCNLWMWLFSRRLSKSEFVERRKPIEQLISGRHGWEFASRCA